MDITELNKTEGVRDTATREADALETKEMMLNMGPSHPAMHGIIRLILKLDGEVVKDCEVHIGYLHRAFEKMCEEGGYLQVIPYTDRLNYVSPLINNVGYCMAVEKLFGIKTTERCDYIRVIMSELSRITDHLTCVGASAMEVGAFTVFLYMIKAREYLWELIEEVTGARLTISYTRVGGLKSDLPAGFAEKCRTRLKEVRKVNQEVHTLLTKNRIFIDRMKGIGTISQEDAVAYSVTGPFLRATGVDYDVRKDNPYLIYNRLDFDVPVGEYGDNFDRYLVRMEEMEQSIRIVEQCLDQMPKGPVAVDMEGRAIPAEFMVDEAKMGRTGGLLEVQAVVDPTLEGGTRANFNAVQTEEKRAILPPKEDTYGNIEGLMQHFKLVMYGHGIRPPKGDTYQAVEGANGELGFYIVSDGTDRPYRVRVRPPCFTILAAFPLTCIGWTVSDIIPTFGSVNMIGGELDR